MKWRGKDFPLVFVYFFFFSFCLVISLLWTKGGDFERGIDQTEMILKELRVITSVIICFTLEWFPYKKKKKGD